MKSLFYVVLILFSTFGFSQKNGKVSEKKKITSDTIHIKNDELEYEITIIDLGFANWLNGFAKPRGFYSQNFLEVRNKTWVLEWNRRVMNPFQFNSNLYELTIDFENNINYGYEVNYLLYNYLVYFQITNKQNLGGFIARI